MSALIHARVLERRAAIARAKAEAAERDAFLAAAKGDKGEKGDTGPMPDHQWDGTKLRFQKPDGTWGKWTDLRGKPGKDGKDGAIIISGGSTRAPDPAPGGEEVATYARRVDFVSESVLYRGEAAPGTAESAAGWRIVRVMFGGDGDVTEEWAGGTAEFVHAWADRAELSYS